MSNAGVVTECKKDIGGLKDDLTLSPNNEKREGAIGLLFSKFLRLDTLGKRNGSPENLPTEPPATYYGVYIPCEIKKGPDEGALHVYKNKSEALDLVRRYKVARFKAFRNRQDAVSFALRGAESADVTDGVASSVMGEKPYPFKAPSPQEMVSLRKAIEAGLADTVLERIWDNPRYLVSSGNTPAIMQEGSRYNALHVAAKALNAEITNMVLNTVGNPAFVHTLYGTDADLECCREFATILVDRYLNTPDKAMNETPLHFAAKFGAEEVVDVLTSFPQCNKLAVNKFGEQPKDVICKRTSTSGPETARNISRMLLERFYVPVLHTDDGSAPPAIGRPFTPAMPPDLNSDPLSPRYEIRAFAGPMEATCADQFRRKWKTPPRTPTAGGGFRLREMSKGFESIGRNLAEKMKVEWKEYWPFLDTFTDLRTPEGLLLLENYLKSQYESACCYQVSSQDSPPEELSISRINLTNSTIQSPISEPLSPMSELCVAMKSCAISGKVAHWRKTDPIRQRLCRQPNPKPMLTNGDAPIPPANHTVSQLLCIERTCQVFAMRIADALAFSLTAEPEVAGDSLKAESKHLQHTISTYMDDERFKDIDFCLLHSRLAQLVVYKLKERTTDLDDVNRLVEFLMKLRCPNDDIFSSDDERKTPQRGVQNRCKINKTIDTHVRCLASFISEELTENDATGPAMTESECTDIWDRVSKCRCEWRLELYERSSKRNASFRKNRSILSTSPKNDSFMKRLSFDQDMGDSGPQPPLIQLTPAIANTPSGDCAGATADGIYAEPIQCEAIENDLISDDESGEQSDCEYVTASDRSGRSGCASDSDEDRMADASDRALVDAFIHGEEPTKMDRLVYEAVAECAISADQMPHVYRWRHTVALYTPEERELWPPAPPADDSANSSAAFSFSVCQTPRLGLRARRFSDRASTPKRPEHAPSETSGRAVNLQISNWLRVTGPNSPRTALSANNVDHNVSFGF